jgi:hypothetical protein
MEVDGTGAALVVAVVAAGALDVLDVLDIVDVLDAPGLTRALDTPAVVLVKAVGAIADLAGGVARLADWAAVVAWVTALIFIASLFSRSRYW